MAAIPYAFDNVKREHSFQPLEVEGTVPADLRGTVVCNGPGLLAPFGQRYRHWFDGDGAVRGVRFADGQAYGAARVIDSAGLQAERRAGRHLYDSYGTTHANFWQRLLGKSGKNTANTSVLFWQDQLFALVESSKPTQLRAADFTTVGESSLGNVVRGAFSAHPHYVPARKTTYNFGITRGRTPQLELYALPDTGSAQHMGSVPLHFESMVHDFIATPNYLIFFLTPLRMRLLSYMFGASFSNALQWEPQRGTEVVVVPIDQPQRATRFHTEAFFLWHFCNAFERGGDNIIVDFVRYDDFSINAGFVGNSDGGVADTPLGRYRRATLSVQKQTLSMDAGSLLDTCEFPKVAPSQAGADAAFAYAVQFEQTGTGAGLPCGIAKVDLHGGSVQRLNLGPQHMPSEALFIARANAKTPDDGYLVSLVLDPHKARTYAAVIDATNFSAGPVAKVWFDQALPLSFHGTYIPH